MTGWKKAVCAFALIGAIGTGMFTPGAGTLTSASAEDPPAVTAEAEPTPKPTPEPTAKPTPEPTPKPTPEPPPTPTAEPTSGPTQEPTAEPTSEPTAEPTAEVTLEPTDEPTSEPTAEPTEAPTRAPAPTSNELVLKRKSDDWADTRLTDLVYLEGGMKIPALFQYDYTTVIATYGEKNITVASTGCGTTALSMAIAYLTGDTRQTPYTLLYRAVKDGLYRGSGLGHGALSRLARRSGLEAEWVWASEELILEALEAGHPVVAHMGDGTFTEEGHYILLRGVAEDGRIYVTDPNSRANSEKTYSLYQLFKESRTEHPFMILSLPEPEPTPLPTPRKAAPQLTTRPTE